MPLIVIVIFALFLLVAGVGVRNSFWQCGTKKAATSQKTISSSRAEIEKMLKQIEKKKVPKETLVHCIEPGRKFQQPQEEYVCPIDGEKTVYEPQNIGKYVEVSGIERLVARRSVLEQINSMTNLAHFELDERRLCHKCSPDLENEERYVSLVTKYPDGSEHVYKKFSGDDLEMLYDFFTGLLHYKKESDTGVTLKDKTAKVREMLGVKK